MSSNIFNPVPEWFQALSSNEHPSIQRLASTVQSPLTSLPKWHNINDAVVHIIVGQMLSRSAANSIISRLYNRFGSSREIVSWSSRANHNRPQCGLSARKIRALAHWQQSHLRSFKRTDSTHGDYSTIRALFANQWGFGPWSVDMLALFFFCCPNVWPRNDTTIRTLSQRFFRSQHPQCITGHESIVSICLWEIIDRKLL